MNLENIKPLRDFMADYFDKVKFLQHAGLRESVEIYALRLKINFNSRIRRIVNRENNERYF